MKSISLLLLYFVLVGCCKIVAPEEPKYTNIMVVPVEGGMCINDENIAIMSENIRKLKQHRDDLKKEIDKHNGKGN